MKRCGYYGRENADDAARCQQCGTEFGPGPTSGEGGRRDSDRIGRLERIVTLDTEIQAGLVDAVLSDRKIPNIMQTYHDCMMFAIKAEVSDHRAETPIST